MRRPLPPTLAACLALILAAAPAPGEEGFAPLFPDEGAPKGWLVRAWDDLGNEAGPDSEWTVKDGVLRAGDRRGTWLVSEKQYDDFVLEFEIKLTERGNSGVALRTPLDGDPAFEAMEMQIADLRYNPGATEAELTGAIYRALAPAEQVYRPTEWNSCRIELKGSHLKVTFNDRVIQDVDLAAQVRPTRRHDGSEAPPLKDRPHSGHIGFQHLSRDNEPIFIRNARIKPLR
ncbi:DUF1080 domain-containing protein [Paludisphaera sp.]|uniref:3-keto-disaccharide hydrolase n=1 Tax=Paludisphaera sp. TaxID=2017432 RepID=UPI00301DB410